MEHFQWLLLKISLKISGLITGYFTESRSRYKAFSDHFEITTKNVTHTINVLTNSLLKNLQNTTGLTYKLHLTHEFLTNFVFFTRKILPL